MTPLSACTPGFRASADGTGRLDYLRHGRPTSEHREVFLLARAPYRPFARGTCLSGVVRRHVRRAGIAATIGRHGAHVRASAARFRLRHYVAKAAERQSRLREKRVTSHTFRHTAAVHLVEAAVDVTVIQSWLGHVRFPKIT